MIKYRIVTDTYCGYEVQAKVWYWPFWYQVNFTNTHRTIEKAEEYAKQHAEGKFCLFKRHVVKELEIGEIKWKS